MTSQTLSWRDGVLSGFRLVAHRPAAALSWALVFLISGVASAAARIWAVQSSDPEAGFGAIALKLSASGLVVGQIAVVVALAAVLRAQMRPEDQRRAWPRFGGDELRLLALTIPFTLVTLIGSAMMMSALMMYSINPEPIVSRMGALGRLAAVVLVMFGARLALAAPLTVADGRVRLAKSADLTRGRHLRLAAILVTTLVLAGLIEEIASYGRDLLSDALAVNAPGAATRYPSVAEAMNAALGPGSLLLMAFSAMIHVVAFAVQVAPLGYAWRRLAGDPIVDQAAVFD
jgi:hypothetical protein